MSAISQFPHVYAIPVRRAKNRREMESLISGTKTALIGIGVMDAISGGT